MLVQHVHLGVGDAFNRHIRCNEQLIAYRAKLIVVPLGHLVIRGNLP